MPTNFIVVGAAKSGTTLVHKFFLNHPDVSVLPSNEIYYHSPKVENKGPYDKPIQPLFSQNQYIDFFHNNKSSCVGEVATDYLYHYKYSGQSILSTLTPSVKIIIILRHPVQRAFSHYRHMVTNRHEPLPLFAAIEAEEDRKREGWRWAYRYTDVSRYRKQVLYYQERFQEVLILSFDELNDNPSVFFKKVCSFLQIDPDINFDWNERVNVKRPSKLEIVNKTLKIFEKKTRLSKKILHPMKSLNSKILKLSIDEQKLLNSLLADDVLYYDSLFR